MNDVAIQSLEEQRELHAQELEASKARQTALEAAIYRLDVALAALKGEKAPRKPRGLQDERIEGEVQA